MNRRLATASLVIAAAFALAGCATAAPSPNGSSTAPATTTERTPTPSADPLNPANWIASATGIGPFQIGADVTSVEARLPWLSASNEECPNPNAVFLDSEQLKLAAFTDDSGRLTGVTATGKGSYFSAPTPAALDDPLDGPRTASGIGFGSPASAVMTAYPTAEKHQYFDDDGSPFLVVPGGATTLLSFGTDDPPQTVVSINVWPTGLPPYEYCG